MTDGVKIASIDGKDLYIANHYNTPNYTSTGAIEGYTIKMKNGKYNPKKFINALDYSLDLPQIKNIYYKKYRKNNFAFKVENSSKLHSIQVINVTFNYSVKAFDKIRWNTYIKFSYNPDSLEFHDCIARDENNNIVGVMVDTPVGVPVNPEDLPPFFSIEESKNNEKIYTVSSKPTAVVSVNEIRNYLYKNGFWCDGIHYVRFKRSSGASRIGKCLFINEALYKKMNEWHKCGLQVKNGQSIDLAGYESYISLSSSSIIDTIDIPLDSILVIDDYISKFKESVVLTEAVNEALVTSEKEAEIENSIWDGQSLLDESIFNDTGYSDKGMLLVRNRLFKTCCFNTKIQQWFKDNNITDVSQLNGFTLATDISQIKMITTPSSIKYVKFASVQQWLENVDSTFGVVKYDKKTHYFDGEMVQAHYQLLNTLQLSKEDMKEFLQPSLHFMDLLKKHPEVVMQYIKYPIDKSLTNNPLSSKNDIVYELLGVTDLFYRTKYYKDFLEELIQSYKKNIKKGHVYVHGNYSTMVGNPIEMLQQSIGLFKGESLIGVGNVCSTRFDYNTTILGSRSPHVAQGNILIAKNVYNELIEKYINTTDQIICMNAIGENTLQRLSGAD